MWRCRRIIRWAPAVPPPVPSAVPQSFPSAAQSRPRLPRPGPADLCRWPDVARCGAHSVIDRRSVLSRRVLSRHALATVPGPAADSEHCGGSRRRTDTDEVSPGWSCRTVSGIDDGTKNLIGLVHERVGQADITKHLRQREVLGRDKISRDGPVLVVGSRDKGRVVASRSRISRRNRRAVDVGNAGHRVRGGDQVPRTIRRVSPAVVLTDHDRRVVRGLLQRG